MSYYYSSLASYRDPWVWRRLEAFYFVEDGMTELLKREAEVRKREIEVREKEVALKEKEIELREKAVALREQEQQQAKEEEELVDGFHDFVRCDTT